MGICDDAQRRHLFVVRLRIPSVQVGYRVHALLGGFVQQRAAGGDQYIGRLRTPDARVRKPCASS